MIPFRSTDNWSWSSDAFPPLWFCVRALVCDGLHVPPFDRHPDGDGRLRALGLDADVWHAWVAGVIRQHALMAEFAQAMRPNEPPTEAERQGVLAAAKVLTRPGFFCPGSGELKEELNDLFVPLCQDGENWKSRTSSAMPTMLGSGRQGRNLWEALKPFHERLPRFEVFLVEYPGPAVMTIPPSTGIIAPASDAGRYSRRPRTAG